MPPKTAKVTAAGTGRVKLPDKLTDSEKKKVRKWGHNKPRHCPNLRAASFSEASVLGACTTRNLNQTTSVATSNARQAPANIPGSNLTGVACVRVCVSVQLKQANAAKSNPEKANAKKEKNDAKRAGRKEAGSTKAFS